MKYETPTIKDYGSIAEHTFGEADRPIVGGAVPRKFSLDVDRR
ncbi:MAG: hypothetical protein QN168_04360 [Armatimonadota bacterium]|nr:hypothetical protein [Armatimonadota bacterium]